MLDRNVYVHALHNILEFVLDNLSYPGENRSVPDPYYDDNGFEEVFQMLNGACGVFVGRYLLDKLE